MQTVAAHHARSAPWILLLDGNCRLGSVTAPGVGPWLADVEDLSGELFRELLSRLDCWLPATFSSTAAGHGGTLCLRRNGELVRSDYVALPRSWTFSSCLARVDPAVSSGHGGIPKGSEGVLWTLSVPKTCFWVNALVCMGDLRTLAYTRMEICNWRYHEIAGQLTARCPELR